MSPTSKKTDENVNATPAPGADKSHASSGAPAVKTAKPRGRPKTVKPAVVSAEKVPVKVAEPVVAAEKALVKASEIVTPVVADIASPVAAPVDPVVPHVYSKKAIFTVGRRKSAIARLKLTPGKGEMTVNKIDLKVYFPTIELQAAALAPLNVTNQLNGVGFMVKVTGGGKSGQAGSVRHALARALVELDPAFKPTIKKLGFLTRDARVKERKKPGLKGARRAPQWQKR
ncbi:MAG: 30S ribosomal protein S9 [Bacteroidota bacterium]